MLFLLAEGFDLNHGLVTVHPKLSWFKSRVAQVFCTDVRFQLLGTLAVIWQPLSLVRPAELLA